MRRLVKQTASLLARVFVLPLALIAGFGKFHQGFVFGAQLLAPFPGLIGSYLRVAYYKQTLEHVGSDCHIAFGSYFAHPEASMGTGVGIGAYSVLGHVDLADRTRIATGVQILSGANQHRRNAQGRVTDEGRIPRRLQIGCDCWIGASATIMGNLGDEVTVAAGWVVFQDVPSGATVAGNPTRLVSLARAEKASTS